MFMCIDISTLFCCGWTTVLSCIEWVAHIVNACVKALFLRRTAVGLGAYGKETSDSVLEIIWVYLGYLFVAVALV